MSLTDRELLELAAKAAGMPAPYDEHGVFSAWVGDPVHGHWWDPLNDDGDAMRLLFALRLNLEFLGGFKQVQAYRQQDASAKAYSLFGIVGYGSGTSSQPTLDNVRHSIVCAAAAIGKAIQVTA